MSPALPDLSGLVALAQDRTLDLRPVLLRVQTDLFVAAPHRDPETVAAYEALALGFLAVVDHDTAAIVARKLAALPDAPPRVLAALAARGVLARPRPAAPPDDDAPRAEPEPDDLARARDPRPLGRALDDLLGRARARPALAAALLARPDLAPADEAALYPHADAPRRARIRARLAEAPAPPRPAPLPRLDAAARNALIARAAASDFSGFQAGLAAALGVGSAAAWRLDDEAGCELLALTLVAAGLSPDDVVLVFLTLDHAVASSVRAVFHLADLARTTPRPVAAQLAEAALGRSLARPAGRHQPHLDPSGAPDRPSPRARAPLPRARPQRREAEAR